MKATDKSLSTLFAVTFVIGFILSFFISPILSIILIIWWTAFFNKVSTQRRWHI